VTVIPFTSTSPEFQTLTVPQLTEDEQTILGHLYDQLVRRTRRNLLLASYYDGKRALRQVGSVIPPQYYRLGIVLGWSAKAVDILARRCNCDSFVWPDGDLDSLGFRETWDGNHLGSEISSALISSLIHGTSFLVNTVGDESMGEPAGLIHVKDALNSTGLWNPRTRQLDAFLSIADRDDNGHPTKFTLYLHDLTIIAEREPTRREWAVTRSQHSWGVPAEPLVYKPRVGKPFGASRISRTVRSLHDQALRTVIRMEGHADVYSYPEMWLLGADESIFKNPDGTQKAAWQVMLGRIKGIPDDDDQENPRAEVKQFAASSPMPHIEQLKQQAQLFAGETAIPLTSLGVSDMSNPTSADSYIASREDLIAEAEGATDDWAPPLQRALARALAMRNGIAAADIPPEWRSIQAKWRSPVYLSRAAQADAGTKQLAAVPWLAETTVGLKLLGLSEQDIAVAQAERRRAEGSAALRQILAGQVEPDVGEDGDDDGVA
jgi:hypothetical protein